MITQENIDNLDELAIFEVIELMSDVVTIEDMLAKNIKLLSLDRADWTMEKGRRTERVYSYVNENGDTVNVIKDIYVYTLSSWEVASYVRRIQWLLPDESVGLEKEVKTESGFGAITKLNRTIKEGIIDSLREKAKNLELLASTVPEPYTTFYNNIANSADSILDHYYSIIKNNCLDFTWQPWIDAINGETDADVIVFLDTPADETGAVLVRHIIFAEIT